MIASIPPARKMVSRFAGVAAPLPIATMHCRPHQTRHEQEHSTRARHLTYRRRGGMVVHVITSRLRLHVSSIERIPNRAS